MPSVVIRLRVFVTHKRFGGERFVAAFPRDRVRELIARLLVEAGIEDDPRKWELFDGVAVFSADRTVGELLADNPPTDALTLRPAPPQPRDFTHILLERKIISPEQLEDSKRVANATGRQLHAALVTLHYATADQVMRAIAELHGLPFIELTDVVIPTAVIELVPESVARENLVLPLVVEGNTLRIAVSDPTDTDTILKVRFILNKDIARVLATAEQIREAINRHYGQTETESVDSMLTEFPDTAIDSTRSDATPAAPARMPAPGTAPAPPAERRRDAADDEELGDEEFDDADLDDEAEERGEVFETDFEVPPGTTEGGSDEFELTLGDSNLPAPVAASAAAPAVVLGAGPPNAAVPRADTATGAKRKAKARTTQRRATVRYYSRMNPDRVFPLLVMLTREEVEKVVKQHVEQKATGPLKLATDTPVEIEPVLPGCVCHPPKVLTRLDAAADQVFTFHVVPHVLGEVTGARLLIRQDHATLAEIKLDMRVMQRTLVMVSGVSTFALPAASAAMKHFGLDFTPKDGSNPYLAALNLLFGEVSPVLLTLALAAVTGLAWWFTRPKGRDVFWDITTKPPSTAP